MGGIKDQEKIEELRNRLYQRGTSGVGNVHHSLSDEETPVPTSWDITKKYEQNQSEVPIPEAVPETYEPVLGGSDMKKNKKV